MSIVEIIGFAGYVVGAAIVLASKTKSENLKDLKDRVEILEKELVYSKEALEKERGQAREQHIANRESIAKLQGQVELYKDLQLKSIAETNQQILNTLKNSAIIAQAAAKDGGLLVHTEESSLLDVKVKE